jgi:hypothetical protein
MEVSRADHRFRGLARQCSRCVERGCGGLQSGHRCHRRQGQAGVLGEGESQEREEDTGEGGTGQAEKDSLSEQKSLGSLPTSRLSFSCARPPALGVAPAVRQERPFFAHPTGLYRWQVCHSL